MQICVAYCFDRDPGTERVERGLERVERHYGPLSAQPLVRRGRRGARVGAHVWDAAVPACEWPVWADEGTFGVGTVYVPIGWRRVIGPVPVEAAPVPLMRALVARPEVVADLHPPFVMAAVDEAEDVVDVVVDGLGFGRMYEMRFAEGWVWSNRLGALPLFAEHLPAEDRAAWQLLAGGGWFMGDTTPIEGVTMLPPGASVRAGEGLGLERVARSAGAVQRWVTPRPRQAPDEDAMAEQLVGVAHDVAALWSRPARVDLSGGRDSRAVAAATLHAGIEASYHTTATFPDEAELVVELLGRLPREVPHHVVVPGNVTRSGDLRERAEGLHALYDGMTSPTFLTQSKARKLGALPQAQLSGAGGEIAHGHYYPASVTRLHKQGFAGAFKRLDGSMRWHGGVTDETHDMVSAHVTGVLEEGEGLGLQGAVLLDYFYLVERLRRWSSASIRLGRLMPLTTPSFLRASFDLAPEERSDNLLHRRLIARLMPKWAELPFYKADATAHKRSPKPFSWQTTDRSVLEEIVHDASLWDDVFDARRVRELWTDVTEGRGVPRHEALLQRLVWRATYPEHRSRLAAQVAWRPLAPEVTVEPV